MDDLIRRLRVSGEPPGGLALDAATRVLPLAGLHLEYHCHPAPAHGYTLPLWYTGALDEQLATRERAGLFDRSHLGRFYVTGEAAPAVLAAVLATNVEALPPGAVSRAVACREDGTILDLPTLCHLDPGRWLVVTGPRHGPELQAAVEAAATGYDVLVNDRASLTVLLSLQGPAARDVAAEVFGRGLLDSVPREGCRELLLGVHRAALVRTSQVGEDGLWLLLNPDDAAELWRGLVAAGATPAGLAAHDALRLEAAVIEAPAEAPAPATPEAAGLGALVDLQGHEFTGAAALRAAPPPERHLTGLRLEGPRLARRGTRVTAAGRDLGACVAAAYSPTLEAGVALAYLAPGLDRLEVDTDGVPQPVRAVPLPFVPPRQT